MSNLKTSSRKTSQRSNMYTKPEEQNAEVSAPNSETDPSAKHSMNTMESLRRDEKHCDAVIEAGGEKFEIHRSIFAIHSDYFDKVFTVKMQEKYDNVVRLERTPCDVMKCIVDFIYTGNLAIDCENAVELLVASDYLRIEKIKTYCVSHMMRSVAAENCVRVWVCAKTYNLEELIDKSLKIFGAKLLSLPLKEFERLSNKQFTEIMESSKQLRKSEEESFTVAATWAKFDVEKRKNTFCTIFQSFRLDLFSINFLRNIVENESIISSSEVLQQVAMEVISRLDEACEQQKKTKQQLAKMNEDKQELADQNSWLAKENKRLVKQEKKSTKSVQEAKSQRKILLEDIQRIIENNKDLKKKLESFFLNAQQSVLQYKEAARETQNLVQENRRLTGQIQKSETEAQQHEEQLKNATARIEYLNAKMLRLSEELREGANIAHLAVEQHRAAVKRIKFLTEEKETLIKNVKSEKRALDTRIGRLTEENEQLKKAVHSSTSEKRKLENTVDQYIKENQRLIAVAEKWLKCSNETANEYQAVFERLQFVEVEKRKLEVKIEKLLKDKQQLAMQAEIERCYAQQARSENISLESRMASYVAENHRLSTLAKKRRMLNLRAKLTGEEISRVVNDSSKSSWFWCESTYLSDTDKNFINLMLKQLIS